MDIDKILKELATSIGKRKTDLKKTFNSILKKKKEEDGLADLLGEDGFNHLGLLGVCKRYDIDPDVLEEIMSKPEAVEPEEEDCGCEDKDESKKPTKTKKETVRDRIIKETGLSNKSIDDLVEDKKRELKGLISEEGALFIITRELGIEGYSESPLPKKIKVEDIEMDEDWKDIFSSVRDPSVYTGEGEESQFENLPKFKPMINVKYHIRLRNPSKAPNKVERKGNWGPYRTYPTDIVIVKILSDLDTEHEEGKSYVFWMAAALSEEDMAKEFDHFAKFWITLGTAPDNRVFEVLKTQAKSKKSGRNYNVWRFGEA